MTTKVFSQLESDGSKAARGFAKILAVLIVLAVAAFGDVMYILEMQKVFPSGLLLAFCYLGAFTSFLAIGYLLLGKSVVFRPGGQMLAAWIVFGAELVIIALNVMLVFSGAHSGFLGVWAYLSPATPVFHMLGVAMIFFLDPELREKHKDMELDAKLRQADRDYEHAVQMAKIRVKHKQLEHTVRELEAAVNSEDSITHIRRHAIEMNTGLLIEMSGRALPEGRIVESDLPTDIKKEIGKSGRRLPDEEVTRWLNWSEVNGGRRPPVWTRQTWHEIKQKHGL